MKYYVAYGSNLNREQMAHRCPEAKLVGKGHLFHVLDIDGALASQEHGALIPEYHAVLLCP